ncbi:MAG TPA: alpha/beta hydrolase [Ktedonobacteraceae bacterium]|nr:alpha/beta hydrolase [Ktedonobacteraceae bacterium]
MLDPSSFLYDQKAPVVLTVLSERVQDEAIIQDVSYASPQGGKVSGYLVVARESKPRAGLIFGHWGEGNRAEFVEEAVILTRLGFVSLCLDAPFRRPEEYEPQLAEPQQGDLQWIMDVRRGVDLLLEHFALSPDALGYVGHSYGATFGGAIAGIERRIKAYVLMAGWYSLSDLMRTSSHPLIERDRNETPPEEFQAYLTAMAPLDACHYIGNAAPAHLFFQFARNDDFVPVKDAERYFELASEPKKIAWYDNCGHELSAQARLDRAIFLCQQLGLAPPHQEILKLLESVPSLVPLAGWADE